MKKIYTSLALLICFSLMVNANHKALNTDQEFITTTINIDEYDIPARIHKKGDEFMCTVRVTAFFNAGSNMWLIDFNGAGTVELEATAETCADAVRDIKRGLRELPKL
ncbi:MAG: hypothetical protein R3250_06575 [Melioribacteraceae bacterium]|nr:hypothetical protein [Melioribacteraceae bacterium]